MSSKDIVERLKVGNRCEMQPEKRKFSQCGNESLGLSSPLRFMGHLCSNRNNKHHRIIPGSLQAINGWQIKCGRSYTEASVMSPFFTLTDIFQEVEGTMITSPRMMGTLSFS